MVLCKKIQFVEEKDVVSMLSKAGVFDEKNKTANNTLLDRYSYVLHEGKGGHKMTFHIMQFLINMKVFPRILWMPQARYYF